MNNAQSFYDIFPLRLRVRCVCFGKDAMLTCNAERQLSAWSVSQRYFLGGHSIGGVLALEMAAQLEVPSDASTSWIS